eukprot:1810869-Pyramimonas_sp.AAC.2
MFRCAADGGCYGHCGGRYRHCGGRCCFRASSRLFGSAPNAFANRFGQALRMVNPSQVGTNQKRLSLEYTVVSPIRSAHRWNILLCRQLEVRVVGIYRCVAN